MSQKWNAIIRAYRQLKLANPDTWITHCANQNSFNDTIRAAALCRNAQNKKHPHQYRLTEANLLMFAQTLLNSQHLLATATTFDQLIDQIRQLKSFGIGELAIYDTAVRIGAFLNLTPSTIYLHAGTREGLKKLLPNFNGNTVNKNQLPEPFKSSTLTCVELEDLLCIYKDRF